LSCNQKKANREEERKKKEFFFVVVITSGVVFKYNPVRELEILHFLQLPVIAVQDNSQRKEIQWLP